MKRTLAIGAVIAACAAAVMLRPTSETDTTPGPALRGASEDAPATPQSNLVKPEASPSEEATADPPSSNEVHPTVPANEPRSDAIVPPVKRAKPKDPVLAGDPVEEPKKGPKNPAKPEPAKGAAKP